MIIVVLREMPLSSGKRTSYIFNSAVSVTGKHCQHSCKWEPV